MSCEPFDLHAPLCPICNDAMRPAVKRDYSKPPITHMLVWECKQPHEQGDTQ